MDNKKIISYFITHVCDWIEDKYKNENNDRFEYDLRNDRLSYLIADKGIEKRIQKQLFKRLNVQSRVTYELESSPNQYLDGILRVKLIK